MRTIEISNIKTVRNVLGKAGEKEFLNTKIGATTIIDIGGYRYIIRPKASKIEDKIEDKIKIHDLIIIVMIIFMITYIVMLCYFNYQLI